MLDTSKFGEELKKIGFDFYTGVPCSFLKNLINYAINECEYVIAANEGDAVAVASGAYLGGRKSVVLIQNSGLTNCVSPITSLNYIFKIPVLGFVSLRGEKGIQDQPQHDLMGIITTDMLDLMRVKWEYLSNDLDEAKEQLKRADEAISNNETFFFVVKKNTFEKVDLSNQKENKTVNKVKKVKTKDNALPTRLEALEVINELKDKNTVHLATTGKTGRELFEVEDTPNNLYMVGSMGCISSLGLGLAMVKNDKDVVVIDGDGSALMRLGSFATNAFYNPSNMLHVLLDNSTYDSTGGQKTVADNVDFVEITASCGYPNVVYAHDLDEFKKEFLKWKKEKTLTLLYLKIAKGSKKDLGRPNVTPIQVKERLIEFLNN